MRVLITGAAGFIGQHVVRHFQEAGWETHGYDRLEALEGLRTRLPDASLHFGDFRTEQRWESLLKGVDVCVHLISTTIPKTSNDDPLRDVDENVQGSLRLLQAAAAVRCRVVFSSSGGTVYGAGAMAPISEDAPTYPICSYGITKLSIEKYIHLLGVLHGLRGVALRLANPYGEGQPLVSTQGVIAVFVGRVLRGEAIEIWGDGSVVRDYLHVDDVARAFVLAASNPDLTGEFNIGSGQGLSLREVIDEIARAVGRPASVRYLPSRRFDVPRNVLDIRKAQTQLGWHPKIAIQDGLRRMLGSIPPGSA